MSTRNIFVGQVRATKAPLPKVAGIIGATGTFVAVVESPRRRKGVNTRFEKNAGSLATGFWCAVLFETHRKRKKKENKTGTKCARCGYAVVTAKKRNASVYM